ncbi:hypothetical protein ACT3QR_11805 [Psychrobacter sp. AOP7-B1-25]|uniref:hypothetical protein n=1 Tax=Psychrobacter sp. AOP7-B1-25 TaxID=3457644 RepID=UPI00402B3BAB
MRNIDLFDFSVSQNLLTPIILIVSLLLLLFFFGRKKKDLPIMFLLFSWHTLFSLLYFYFTAGSNSVGDSRAYYLNSLSGHNVEFVPGTRFVTFATYLLTRNFELSYLNVSLIYNMIGAFGLLLLYLSLKKHLESLPWYWTLILFLPSISYWSSAIGKDSIAFFAVSLLIYAATVGRKKIVLYFIVLLLMFMIRPHVAFIMAVSYLIYFIVQSKAHIVLKLIFIPIIATGTFLSLGFIQEYTGLDEASLSGISDFYDERQGSNMNGGGAIDTSSMPLPLKVFSYIFRPLPFEAHSFIAFVASIENTFLLIFSIFIIYRSKSKLKVIFTNERLWLSLYVLLISIMLSYGLSNLGIAARQKWMFMPVVIYLLIYLYNTQKLEKARVYP